MTVAELRQILFEVENQEMTVRQLREILYKINNQNIELSDFTLRRITRKTK